MLLVHFSYSKLLKYYKDDVVVSKLKIYSTLRLVLKYQQERVSSYVLLIKIVGSNDFKESN